MKTNHLYVMRYMHPFIRKMCS